MKEERQTKKNMDGGRNVRNIIKKVDSGRCRQRKRDKQGETGRESGREEGRQDVD